MGESDGAQIRPLLEAASKDTQYRWSVINGDDGQLLLFCRIVMASPARKDGITSVKDCVLTGAMSNCAPVVLRR